MENYLEFNGLKHYPLGQAKLEIIEENLIVSNISDSGLDGVSIHVDGSNDFEANFQEVTFEPGVVITSNLSGVDNYGRVKVINQQTTYVDSEGLCRFAFNSKLLGERAKLKALLDGEVTFEKEYTIPQDNPDVNWWWVGVVVAVAKYVADHVDYTSTTETYTGADGKTITKTTTTKSWNGDSKKTSSSASIGSVKVIDVDGDEFEADMLYLESSNETTNDSLLYEPQMLDIYLKGVNSFTITNEMYNRD